MVAKTTVELEHAPIDLIRRVSRVNGWSVPENIEFLAKLPNNWNMQNMVSKDVIPQEPQEKAVESGVCPNKSLSGYMVAWLDTSGSLVPSMAAAAENLFFRMVDEYNERTNREPCDTKVKIMRWTSATVVVKQWATSHMIEKSAGEVVAERRNTKVDEPQTYVEAVRRETEDIDFLLENGDVFQVKAAAGSYSGDKELVKHPNFEDYAYDNEVEISIE